MKLINRVDFAYIAKYYTQNGPERPKPKMKNKMSGGCLRDGCLMVGCLHLGLVYGSCYVEVLVLCAGYVYNVCRRMDPVN